LLEAKVAQLELSLQNEQASLVSNTKAATIHTEEVITVTNGEKDGRWGRLESCPTGSRAVGYQTQNKFEALFEDVDETGLNMLVIFCDDPLQTKISSPVGL
jgi:type I site-specific restriction endonuclease